MTKYTIERTNTDVRKLWNLAYNGILDKRTVSKIFENSDTDVITFNSKHTYDKFIKFQFSNSAYYKNWYNFMLRTIKILIVLMD